MFFSWLTCQHLPGDRLSERLCCAVAEWHGSDLGWAACWGLDDGGFFHPFELGYPYEVVSNYVFIFTPNLIYKGISGLVTSQGALEDWEMVTKLWEIQVHVGSLSRWWFQRFFMFIPICGNYPIWRIVSKWVEITNQVLKLLFFWEHENTFGGPHRIVMRNQHNL